MCMQDNRSVLIIGHYIVAGKGLLGRLLVMQGLKLVRPTTSMLFNSGQFYYLCLISIVLCFGVNKISHVPNDVIM